LSSSAGDTGRWRLEDPGSDDGEAAGAPADQPDESEAAPRRHGFREALEARREERLSGRKGPVWKWIEQNGDDIFWLVVGGIGFTLIVGTGIRQVLDTPAAFVIAGAIWVLIAWRILALLRRRTERLERMRRELDVLEGDEPS